ncbi:YciI family protein [Leptospira sp. 85282-16]|uniref:Transcription initiation protein n=1 Tax=Leptospira montravelensis TaxID=2484961 RepID=A0ABY2LLL7_9LEPT|nr:MULTISPECIES: YciI family protein [Leptospira]MCT8333455.1 YciI family protein [Leptospira sp. 85282-16]TGK79895.1 transcription initiation protein [Leptospira montravelensis]TGL00059.1 transcription initiation protein [Leptospira montravelensis]
MKEFTLIFRNSNQEGERPSPEQMQRILQEWMSWMTNLSAKEQLADKGNRLAISDAKTVHPGHLVTDGPYTEIKEFINGYIVVKTESLNEAVEIAKGCPILKIGGNVEVRKVVTPDDHS